MTAAAESLQPDGVDVRLLLALVKDPRLSVSQLAESCGISRNTAQARLDRLSRAGVLGENERGVALRPMGFTVSAVAQVEVEHARLEETIAALSENSSVVQVEEIAGAAADLLVRIAARDTDDLKRVVHTLLDTPGIQRTTTMVVLAARVPYRVAPLLARLAAG